MLSRVNYEDFWVCRCLTSSTFGFDLPYGGVRTSCEINMIDIRTYGSRLIEPAETKSGTRKTRAEWSKPRVFRFRLARMCTRPRKFISDDRTADRCWGCSDDSIQSCCTLPRRRVFFICLHRSTDLYRYINQGMDHHLISINVNLFGRERMMASEAVNSLFATHQTKNYNSCIWWGSMRINVDLTQEMCQWISWCDISVGMQISSSVWKLRHFSVKVDENPETHHIRAVWWHPHHLERVVLRVFCHYFSSIIFESYNSIIRMAFSHSQHYAARKSTTTLRIG